MTLFEFEELAEYWAEHPPVHLLVGAYFGVGGERQKQLPSPSPRIGRQTGSDLDTVIARLGAGFDARDVHAGLAPVVLDFGELQRRAKSRS